MSATARIKKFLRSMPPGQLIRNKDLERFANRDLYDKVLSNECRAGNLTRLATGVYMLPGAETPSRDRVAVFKTAGFGKTIYPGGNSSDGCVYFTDGATSSFQFRGQTLRIVRKSARHRKAVAQMNSIDEAEHAQPSGISRFVANKRHATDESVSSSIKRMTLLVNRLFELVHELCGAAQAFSNQLEIILKKGRHPFDGSTDVDQRKLHQLGAAEWKTLPFF